MTALQGRRIRRIAGGWRHTLAADDEGRLWAWGWNKVRLCCAPLQAGSESRETDLVKFGRLAAHACGGTRALSEPGVSYLLVSIPTRR